MKPLAILQTAYRLTINHPELWFFGLFLSAGFNFHLSYFYNFNFFGVRSMVLSGNKFWELPQAGLLIGIVLVIAVLVIIFVNWLKIIFVFNLGYLFKIEQLGMKSADQYIDPSTQDFWQRQKRWARQARQSLVAVVGLSLITMTLTLIITAGLIAPLFWEAGPLGMRSGLGLLAGLLFVVVVFFSSCLNIFGSFGVVLYQKRIVEALAIAWSMIWAKFKPLVVLSGLLVIIYLCGLSLGLLGAGLIRHAYDVLLAVFIQLRWQSIAGVLRAYNGLGTAVFWLWFGIINTFFNTVLFGFFVANIRPHKLEEESFTGAAESFPAPVMNSTLGMDRDR